MDAETGNALPIPEPNTFSFNSPKEVAHLVKVWERLRKLMKNIW
jgi:hypothetical protein